MFVILLSSCKNSFGREEYGYWTGKHHTVQGDTYPVCDKSICNRTKTYLTRSRAEMAAQSAMDKFGYVQSFEVEEISDGTLLADADGMTISEMSAAKPKRKTVTSTAVKRKYNKKVYSRIFADLPIDLVARFKEAVKTNGTTTAAVLRSAMAQYVEENEQSPVGRNAQKRPENDRDI